MLALSNSCWYHKLGVILVRVIGRSLILNLKNEDTVGILRIYVAATIDNNYRKRLISIDSGQKIAIRNALFQSGRLGFSLTAFIQYQTRMRNEMVIAAVLS
jgi:hypothetical protein